MAILVSWPLFPDGFSLCLLEYLTCLWTETLDCLWGLPLIVLLDSGLWLLDCDLKTTAVTAMFIGACFPLGGQDWCTEHSNCARGYNNITGTQPSWHSMLFLTGITIWDRQKQKQSTWSHNDRVTYPWHQPISTPHMHNTRPRLSYAGTGFSQDPKLFRRKFRWHSIAPHL